MKSIPRRFHHNRVAAWLAMLCLACASGPALAWAAPAQSTQAEQQARANQVRDQLRANALREQQRQQTSDTLRKAFKSNRARQGIDQADQARRDRNQAQQRNRVEDYLHREQADTTAKSGKSDPAHATSGH